MPFQRGIQLPDVTLESNQEWDCLWALMDSGSSIHGIDCEKFIPGATVEKSPSQLRGDTYSCANGGILENRGQARTPARLATHDGRQRNITWQNVKIEFPILGTKGLAADPDHKSEIRYRENGGTVVELEDKHESAFVSHGDVYFMKVYLRKKDMRTTDKGFVRLGAA